MLLFVMQHDLNKIQTHSTKIFILSNQIAFCGKKSTEIRSESGEIGSGKAKSEFLDLKV
jgi:ABC-type Mn2+/Zn2+ transport system ATPase subunit